MSLKGAVTESRDTEVRDYVVIQNKMIQGVAIDCRKPEPGGRMVRSEKFKYCVFVGGKRNESLIDMEDNPGEMRNLAGKSEYEQVLHQHRRYLVDWCHATNDAFAVHDEYAAVACVNYAM